MFPSERRDVGQEFGRDIEAGVLPGEDGLTELPRVPVDDDRGQQVEAGEPGGTRSAMRASIRRSASTSASAQIRSPRRSTSRRQSRTVAIESGGAGPNRSAFQSRMGAEPLSPYPPAVVSITRMRPAAARIAAVSGASGSTPSAASSAPGVCPSGTGMMLPTGPPVSSRKRRFDGAGQGASDRGPTERRDAAPGPDGVGRVLP